MFQIPDIGQQLECSPLAREAKVQSQAESYQRLKKWYLMLPGLTLSIIRVRIKGKVEQSRERSLRPSLHLSVVAIEKGAFGSSSTMVANFTYLCFK